MPSAGIDAKDLRCLSDAITRVTNETFRSAQDSVEYIAVSFVQSARQLSKSPPGKRSKVGAGQRTHEVKTNPNHRLSKKYVIVQMRQTGPPKLVPTNNKRDPRRKIKRAGLSWAVWGAILAKLNAKSGNVPLRKTAWRRSMVAKTKNPISPSIEIVNALSYASNAYPGIVAAATKASTAKVLKNLDRKQERIARAWRHRTA